MKKTNRRFEKDILTSINPNRDIQKMIELFIFYYKIYDQIEGTIHSLIIEKLYFTTNRYMNLYSISDACNIELRTLYRYREKYKYLFTVICNSEFV